MLGSWDLGTIRVFVRKGTVFDERVDTKESEIMEREWAVVVG